MNKKQKETIEIIGREIRGRTISFISGLLGLSFSIYLFNLIYPLSPEGLLEYIGFVTSTIFIILISCIFIMLIIIPFTNEGFNNSEDET